MKILKFILVIFLLGTFVLKVDAQFLSQPLLSLKFDSYTTTSKKRISPSINLQTKNHTSKLRLITTLLEKKISPADNDLYIVDLKLKLKYLNEEDGIILVYKGWSSIPYILISESYAKALVRDYERSIHIGEVTANEKSLDELTLKNFVALSKGDSYETEETIRLFVKYDSSKDNGGISKGNHILQIVANLWEWNDKESERLRNKLKRYGDLWTDSVTSEPMPFSTD